MFPAERRQLLLDAVLRSGAASLHELCAVSGASAVTVRRDLAVLEQHGALVRSRGGALAPSGFEPSYRSKVEVAIKEKTAIARAAAERVCDGDSVILGAGTTTQLLARALRTRVGLTVVTNSLLVGQELADASGVEVMLTGGDLRGSTFSLIGAVAEGLLATIHASAAFLSGNGMTAERGLSTPHPGVAAVDRAIAGAAREVVVLADHTKIGVDALVRTVPVDAITELITDEGAPPVELRALQSSGVRVTVCSV